MPAVKGKPNDVEAALRSLISSLPAGAKLPTFRQLMSDFSASQSKVAAAMDRLEAQRLVVRRAGSGVYVPDHARTGQLLILLDGDFAMAPSPVWSILLQCLIKECGTEADEIEAHLTRPSILGMAKDDDEALPARVWSRISAGLYRAVISIGVDERLVAKIGRMGCQTVAFSGFGRFLINIASDWSCSQGVIELARAHCCRISMSGANNAMQYSSYRAAVERLGLIDEPIPLAGGERHAVATDDQSVDQVRRGFDAGVRHHKAGLPEGILLLDDMFAQGYLMALEDARVNVGRDIKVVATTNRFSPVLLAWHRKITRLELDVQEVARLLCVAANVASRGEVPTQGGWEHAVAMLGSQGESLDLSIRPRIIPSESIQ